MLISLINQIYTKSAHLSLLIRAAGFADFTDL